MSDGLSRREVLAGLGVGAGYLVIRGDDGELRGGAAGVSVLESTRTETLRPIPGGVGITHDDSDGAATVGGGFENSDGERRLLTCRHFPDPNFCGGSDNDVLGVEIQQFDESAGSVSDVGSDSGANATDWAAIAPADGVDITGYVAGCGVPQGTASPEVGERVVLSGARTGVVGGEIIGESAAKVFRGCQFYDLVQYSVDEGTDTNGNSGGLVGRYNDLDEFELVGVHVFGDDDGRYALPIDSVLDAAGLGLLDDSSRPDSGAAGRLEGTVISHDSAGETVRVIVSNTGGENSSGDVTLSAAGEEIDATSVDLSSFTEGFVQLDTGGAGTVVLDTGDVAREIDLPE